ncbi:MAG: MMPL family transporter [Mycobacteriaceae bacterium]
MNTGATQPQLKRSWPFFSIFALAIAMFLIGGGGTYFESKLSEVQENNQATFLPSTAESTIVANESKKFLSVETSPGFVIFHRDTVLSPEDRISINKALNEIKKVEGVDRDGIIGPQFDSESTTANIFVPLIASSNGEEIGVDELAKVNAKVLEVAKSAVSNELQVLPAGLTGLFTAFNTAFSGIDGVLLLAAVLVVSLILLVIYRSPVLWILPLLSALLALGSSSLVIYFLAKHDVLTLTAQSQGILSVLVLGAGTDYALLLISRYREELHIYPNRFDAMIKAWKESLPAIFASAITVIIGVLCLTLSELNSNKSLGPVAAIGIVSTFLVMMSFLPVILTLLGRWIFWPRIPRPQQSMSTAENGFWSNLAKAITQRHRFIWVGTTAALLLCVMGMFSLKTEGLTAQESFSNRPDAVVGQEIYEEKFDKGTGTPAIILTNANYVDDIIATTSKVEGVSQKPGSVCIQPDLTKLSNLLKTGVPTNTPITGCLPTFLNVQPIDGKIIVNAVLANPPDSPEALKTVEQLRTSLRTIEGAEAKVGGNSALNLDIQTASVRDRNLIIPVVLLVIFIVLALLLRSLLAPLLLIATVVLSFAATLGVSGLVFEHLLGFAGADQSFPLFAFVFLVALGIDYNIFLMTRVREETLQHGTREGITRGLAVTGGVITSAGVVLAATFAVLGVVPLVFLAELGFAVAFGVLLDTIIVRSILVPALAHDIGKKIWWPSALANGKD